MDRAYNVVDVFTATPLMGNPVAVVLDAEGLTTSDMQAIAAWTNLSETTFLLPPEDREADYRLRIFTPRGELPFAGHPTLGSAHAALEAGRVSPRGGRLVQQCDVGLVALSVEGEERKRNLAFSLPPATIEPLDAVDVDELEAILGAKVDHEAHPAIVNVGAVWVVAQLSSAEHVLSLRPNFARSAALERRLGVTGLTVFGAHGHDGAEIEVRSFAPSHGVDEDPVCGSGNGSVALFRRARALVPGGDIRYLATQGQCLGRSGEIAIRIDAAGAVEVGGRCVTTVRGILSK